MDSIRFRTVIGDDRIIRVPVHVPIPSGEVEVALTPHSVENQRLRTLVDRLAGAAEEMGIDTSSLPTDLAQHHDHYLHGLPKRTTDPS